MEIVAERKRKMTSSEAHIVARGHVHINIRYIYLSQYSGKKKFYLLIKKISRLRTNLAV